jgi:S-adenosylmethionine synthetase
MAYQHIFTSESVSRGHPDKVADQISDAVLDLFLGQDTHARVAAETLVTKDYICLAGEARTHDRPTNHQIETTIRDVVRSIGYADEGFHFADTPVDIRLHQQSPDIAQGVDQGDSGQGADIIGAGDQGLMFGHAINETDELMPLPIMLAHRVLRDIDRDRANGMIDGLGSDAKSQFSVVYQNGKPVDIHSVVLSTQHDADVTLDEVRDIVMPYILKVLPDGWTVDPEQVYINPTGRFVIGGPVGDAGLTGRKIIVDTYGGAAAHGGGAFSGKDGTKVDRSASYIARYLAKNVVAAGLAHQCTIQLAYAIGVADPVSMMIDLGPENDIDLSQLEGVLRDLVPLTPGGIMDHLNLRAPIFAETAAYGHFGRNPGPEGQFSWEKTDLVDILQQEFEPRKT